MRLIDCESNVISMFGRYSMKVNKHCVGCGQCAVFCPYDAIIVLGHAAMNDKCVQCGICVNYCPLGAISGDE